MGIWDFINSGKETVKRYTPDLVTPVTKVCKASYYYSTTAVKNIGQYVLDDEGRDKMFNFSTKFVKNASVYAAKEAANIFIPASLPLNLVRSAYTLYSPDLKPAQ